MRRRRAVTAAAALAVVVRAVANGCGHRAAAAVAARAAVMHWRPAWRCHHHSDAWRRRAAAGAAAPAARPLCAARTMRMMVVVLLLLLHGHARTAVRWRSMGHHMWHALWPCCCAMWPFSRHGVALLHAWLLLLLLHEGVAWGAVGASCAARVHVAGRAAAAARRRVLIAVMAVAPPATRLPAAQCQIVDVVFHVCLVEKCRSNQWPSGSRRAATARRQQSVEQYCCTPAAHTLVTTSTPHAQAP